MYTTVLHHCRLVSYLQYSILVFACDSCWIPNPIVFYVTVVGVVGVALVATLLVYAFAMYQLVLYTRRRIVQAREHRRAVEQFARDGSACAALRSPSDLSARSLPDIRRYLRDKHHSSSNSSSNNSSNDSHMQQHVDGAEQRRPVMRVKSSLERRLENVRKTSSQPSANGVSQPPTLYRSGERQFNSTVNLRRGPGVGTRINTVELDVGYNSRPNSSSTYSSSASSSRQSTSLSLFSRPPSGYSSSVNSRPQSCRTVDLRVAASSSSEDVTLPPQSPSKHQQDLGFDNGTAEVSLRSPSFSPLAPEATSPGFSPEPEAIGSDRSSVSRLPTNRALSARGRAFSFDSGVDSVAATSDVVDADADADFEAKAEGGSVGGGYENRRDGRGDGGREHSRPTTAVIVALHVKTALGLLVVLCLTWTFGFFAIGGATTAFSYLFTICNAFAGVFVLIFYGVFKRDVKLAILDLIARYRKWRRLRNKKLLQQQRFNRMQTTATTSSERETETDTTSAASSRGARYRMDGPFAASVDLTSSTNTLSTVVPYGVDPSGADSADRESVSNADDFGAGVESESAPASPTQSPTVIHLTLSKQTSTLSSSSFNSSLKRNSDGGQNGPLKVTLPRRWYLSYFPFFPKMAHLLLSGVE